MAALTSVAAPLTGGLAAPVAVSASDTIAASQFGTLGVYVRVINAGGSPDTVTITDPNTTVVGSVATNPTVTVTNGTTKMIFIPASMLNASTSLATVAHSFTTTVTIEVWKCP
jgi:esterase/lipase superfamily enzyme